MSTIDRDIELDAFDASRPGHVCWVVGDGGSYASTATAMLRRGASSGGKPVAFGPASGRALELLAAEAAVTADPARDFLGGGPLEPDAMFRMFRAQTELARTEGHERLCLVADMDWLLPLEPSAEDIVAFELALDRVVAELDATVVCAYRTETFAPDDLVDVCAVHPEQLGGHEPGPFRFVADGSGWRLSGEVDNAVADVFRTALRTAAADDSCTIDVRELDFIDCAGLRQIATVGRDRSRPIVLDGASAHLRRLWELTGFAATAPGVELRAD